MKIKNKEIRLIVKDKKGKVKANKVVSNLILNNMLNFTAKKMLGLKGFYADPTEVMYFKFGSTQTITETSTEMDYDLKITDGFIRSWNGTDPDEVDDYFLTSFDTGNNRFTTEKIGSLTVGATYDGTQLYGIGFGIADFTWELDGGTYVEVAVPDYLMAFRDVEELDITVFNGETIEIVRIDEYITDGTFIKQDYGFDSFYEFPVHLGLTATGDAVFSNAWAVLSEIAYSYYEDEKYYKKYKVTDYEFIDFGGDLYPEFTVQLDYKMSGNLYDNDDPNLLNGAIIGTNTISSNVNAQSLWIECLPNTTYKISKTLGQSLSAGATAEEPAIGVSLTGSRITGGVDNSLEITTDATSNYLCIYYYDASIDVELLAENVRATLTVEYEPELNAGEVEFIIPDNYRLSTETADYPQEDYPQEDYPANVDTAFVSKRYTYDVWIYPQGFPDFADFGKAVIVQRYHYIKQLNKSTDDLEMKEVIKIERGE